VNSNCGRLKEEETVHQLDDVMEIEKLDSDPTMQHWKKRPVDMHFVSFYVLQSS
jgi:hypothetical protein